MLEKVKKRVGIEDDLQDSQLESIIENVEAELIAKIPDDSVPRQLEFIVIEVSTRRYNRIGAEGMTTESQDGRSNSYELNDFAGYEQIIDTLYPKDDRFKKGRVKFY